MKILCATRNLSNWCIIQSMDYHRDSLVEYTAAVIEGYKLSYQLLETKKIMSKLRNIEN